MSGNPQLRDHLNRVIRARGPIPFSDYMEAALYHPEFGYYTAARSPIGREGDFYTSSNVDSAMGELLAALFCEMADQIEGFALIEMGAGSGLLARQILASHRFPYFILERSPAMRERQQLALQEFEVRWIDSLPSGFRGCLFSNEFFDALPVRRFVRRSGQVRELLVAEGLVEVEGAPIPEVELPLLGEGSIADIAPEAVSWIRRVGASLACGYHLAIDYGYLREKFFAQTRGTLICYRRHRVDEDPYAQPGETDMTAHVNFSDLIDAGNQVGLELSGFRSQKDFLVDLGLLEIMQRLAESGTARSIERLQRLKTLILPPMMGERFKVLLQRKGVSSLVLRGFRAPLSS